MKKVITGLIIGFVIGAVAMISTNVFAAVGDSVTAVFAEFNYVVNGESKTLDAPVLVHDGNSYLRTTQISNMLGWDVTYKADSRTIEFNNELPPIIPPEETPEEPQDGTEVPAPTPSPSPAPDGTEPFPSPSPSPDETGEPSPSPSPSPKPSPTPQPTATPAPSPTPAPDNTAACQAISDDYAYQIGMLAYGEKNDLGHQRYYTLQLEYARDQELSAAGCQ